MRWMWNGIYRLLDGIWRSISERLFVRFEFQIPLKDFPAPRNAIFALSQGGLIDWLILLAWSRRNGLGPLLVTNRKRILILSRPLFFFQIIFGRKTFADLFLGPEPGPRLLFLSPHEKKKPFEPSGSEQILNEIAAGSQTTSEKFLIFPVFILWRKHARSNRRGVFEILLGLNSNPNILGKLWYLLRRRQDSSVKTLAPIELDPLAKAVRRKILVQLNQEMRVVLGPRFLSPVAVKDLLIKDPAILATIDDLEKKTGQDRKKLMMQAYRNLTEIAANYKYRFIEFAYVVLNWIFGKIFEGRVLDEQGIKNLRTVMSQKGTVLVPCHRSHLDYLVVPFTLFENDMVTPHTMAGINLAIFPFAGMMRAMGAFFIRRSFRGDPLYAICLKRYVQYLLSNRYNLMFFIEGTRSRSGKMLPPQYGMLKMLYEAYEANLVEDFAFVPMALSYEEIPEEGAYSKELAGAKKQKESAQELVKTRKILGRRFGKVYVNVAEPILAGATFGTREQNKDAKYALEKTAFQISKAINDATPITPKALICSVLLSSGTRRLSLEEILENAATLADFVHNQNHRLTVSNHDRVPLLRALESALKKLILSGSVEAADSPRTYRCVERKRVTLTFYKNTAMHSLVNPSIAALSTITTQQLKLTSDLNTQVAEAVEFRNLLKFEFFFSPRVAFAEEIKRLLEKMQNQATVDCARLVGDLLESYRTVLIFLRHETFPASDKKTIAARVAKFGQSLLEKGSLKYPESVSIQNYQNALLLMENLDFFVPEIQSEKTLYRFKGWSPEMENLLDRWDDILTCIA